MCFLLLSAPKLSCQVQEYYIAKMLTCQLLFYLLRIQVLFKLKYAKHAILL